MLLPPAQRTFSRHERRPGAIAPVAVAPLVAIAGVAMLALALTSGRYGYHRDELYFIAAGAHPALGYPDQPLLSPLLAHAMDLLAPGSLLVLRAPAILACGVTTLTTGLLARELGGNRRAQALAGACWAAGAVCLVTGHFL
ncbi:MAG: glycosyl transferase, family 39, partial [Solirubrobacteraceae bacterium]